LCKSQPELHHIAKVILQEKIKIQNEMISNGVDVELSPSFLETFDPIELLNRTSHLRDSIKKILFAQYSTRHNFKVNSGIEIKQSSDVPEIIQTVKDNSKELGLYDGAQANSDCKTTDTFVWSKDVFPLIGNSDRVNLSSVDGVHQFSRDYDKILDVDTEKPDEYMESETKVVGVTRMYHFSRERYVLEMSRANTPEAVVAIGKKIADEFCVEPGLYKMGQTVERIGHTDLDPDFKSFRKATKKIYASDTVGKHGASVDMDGELSMKYDGQFAFLCCYNGVGTLHFRDGRRFTCNTNMNCKLGLEFISGGFMVVTINAWKDMPLCHLKSVRDHFWMKKEIVIVVDGRHYGMITSPDQPSDGIVLHGSSTHYFFKNRHTADINYGMAEKLRESGFHVDDCPIDGIYEYYYDDQGFHILKKREKLLPNRLSNIMQMIARPTRADFIQYHKHDLEGCRVCEELEKL